MSYHEGSNWQAKKEDEKKPLYGKEQFENETNRRLTPNPKPPVEGGEDALFYLSELVRTVSRVANKFPDALNEDDLDRLTQAKTILWKNASSNPNEILQPPSQPSTPVQDGWVKIEDGLPSKAGKYIVYGRYAADCPMNVFQSNFYKKDKSFRTDIKTKGVTHWQPLPSPPVNKQD